MTKLFDTTNSLRSLRYAKTTSRAIESNSRHLASGSRITRASDDAAGLSISTKMNATNLSRRQAGRNANDAISVLQVMDGAVSGMSEMVTRLRELAIAASSGTYSDLERDMMNKESTQVLFEIERVSKSSSYLDNKLLTGDKKRLDIQVDAKHGENNRISIDLEDLAQTPYSLGISDVRLDTQHRAKLALAKLDYAQGEIGKSRAEIGSVTSRLSSTINNLEVSVENGSASHSQIKDLDYAQATAARAKNSIVQNAQVSVRTQIQKTGKHYLKLLN